MSDVDDLNSRDDPGTGSAQLSADESPAGAMDMAYEGASPYEDSPYTDPVAYGDGSGAAGADDEGAYTSPYAEEAEMIYAEAEAEEQALSSMDSPFQQYEAEAEQDAEDMSPAVSSEEQAVSGEYASPQSQAAEEEEAQQLSSNAMSNFEDTMDQAQSFDNILNES
jgi:hypothetical protein